MPIKAKCSSCKAVITAKDKQAGKLVRCPHCSNPVRLPGQKIDQVEKPKVREAEEFGDDEFDFGSFDPNAGAALERRKPCPACGEMIMQKAAKCRYCGEVLDPALKKKKKKKKASASYSNDEEDLNAVEIVLCVCCSGIGCIVGIVYMIQGNPKGLKMIGISILMQFIWGALRIALTALQQ